jgi:L-seryl-tRNA(Ser) seleniumtransferase
MRVDKLTLAALEATLRIYLEPARAFKDVPVLAMLTTSADDIQRRAVSVAEALGGRGVQTKVEQTTATVGGGAFPKAQIPSFALSVDGNVRDLEMRLRLGTPAVIARVSDDRLLLDLRSVLPGEDALLTEAIVRACA